MILAKNPDIKSSPLEVELWWLACLYKRLLILWQPDFLVAKQDRLPARLHRRARKKHQIGFFETLGAALVQVTGALRSITSLLSSIVRATSQRGYW